MLPRVNKINLSNGSTLEYKNDRWYKDGKYFTDYMLDKYKYYDRNRKIWMRLGKDGSITPITPYKDKIEGQGNQIGMNADNKVSLQKFRPQGKIITLRTKGPMNLTDIHTNLLDSIAINTARSKTDIKTNLGLIGKESTFGGYSKALGRYRTEYHPHILTNNHAYYNNPYTDYRAALDRMIANQIQEGKDPITAIANAENDAEYAYKHNNIKERTKHYHDNMLADAFARYADNPYNYNSGQGNYVQMVTNIANEVWSNPQIQNWWNTEGIKYYNKGLKGF